MNIRRTLGDRPANPEFIETVPKRGHRFVAAILEWDDAEPQVAATSPPIQAPAPEEITGPAADSAGERISPGRSGRYRLRLFAVLPILAALAATAVIVGRRFRVTQTRVHAASSKKTSIAVLPFADMSASKDEEYFPTVSPNNHYKCLHRPDGPCFRNANCVRTRPDR